MLFVWLLGAVLVAVTLSMPVEVCLIMRLVDVVLLVVMSETRVVLPVNRLVRARLVYELFFVPVIEEVVETVKLSVLAWTVNDVSVMVIVPVTEEIELVAVKLSLLVRVVDEAASVSRLVSVAVKL